jgi:hypothetical protein
MRIIKVGMFAIIIVVSVAGVGCAGESDEDRVPNATSGVETDSGNEEHPPPDDINYETLACTSDDITGAKATGTLTNHSSGLSGYMISVGFLDAAGVRVADATAFVNDVQAGQTTTWEALAFSDVAYARCEIVSVERNAQ